uniref:Gnk2-homologous domain-containing protein n=1 Tax=Populus alba TaxID=43335 RepID=A0A4U5P481_POPAL|nr:hypothetical protein D5086_0000227600 [Populus alba]
MNYISGSAYQQNLNLTLTSLAANASLTGHYISTVGQNPNLVYGLINCPGFISNEVCKTCANSVTTKIIQLCANQMPASVCNENCSLQYSDSQFFSTADSAIRLYFFSLRNADDPFLFRSQLGSFLGNISNNAAADTSRLADGRTSYTSSIDIYGMAHCSIRYEIYSFFFIVNAVTSSFSSPAVQLNSTATARKDSTSNDGFSREVKLKAIPSELLGLVSVELLSSVTFDTVSMAPEYAKKGNFSTKSDVCSFGILVLEIVTGQKISSFRNSINLQSCAWRHWTNGTALELADPTLGGQRPENEILKFIHITLLCVQEAGFYMPRENSGSASGTEDSGSTQLSVSSQQSINWFRSLNYIVGSDVRFLYGDIASSGNGFA